MKLIISVLFSVIVFTNAAWSQSVTLGERYSFKSEVLDEERSYQVYLPPSYFTSPKATFPVVYLLDGDYNFIYDAGLIEFLSFGTYTIPEMIVVGVSDKGGEKQMANCDPKQNADVFIKFLRDELKPKINTAYRTSAMEILIGHSKFGILATHYWMEQNADFDFYLAIDPAYWINEFEMVERVKNDLINGFKPETKLIIAQANTPGMGIDEYVAVLKKYLPEGKTWQLNPYLEDTHGSLHMKSIADALNQIFEGWEMTSEEFKKLKDATEWVEHYKVFKDQYNTEFMIPWYAMIKSIYRYGEKDGGDDFKLIEKGITTHFPNSLVEYKTQLAAFYLANDKVKEAKEIYEALNKEYPDHHAVVEGLGKIQFEEGNHDEAKRLIKSAIEIAKKNKVRQFFINEMEAGLELTNVSAANGE